MNHLYVCPDCGGHGTVRSEGGCTVCVSCGATDCY